MPGKNKLFLWISLLFFALPFWAGYRLHAEGLPASTTRQVDNTPAISIHSIDYVESEDVFRVTLTLTNPAAFPRLEILVKNARTNLTADQFIIPTANTFAIPTTNLTLGEEYDLTITAKDLNGNTVQATRSSRSGTPELIDVAAVGEFRYITGAQPAISIRSVELVYEPEAMFVLTLLQQDVTEVVTYTVWLTNAETGLLVNTAEYAAPLRDSQLQVSLTGAPTGQYTIAIDAKDAQEQILASTQLADVTYAAPKQSLFQRVGGNPLCLGLIGVVTLFLLILLVRSLRSGDAGKFTVRRVNSDGVFQRAAPSLLSPEDKNLHRREKEQRRQIQHSPAQPSGVPTARLAIKQAPGYYRDQVACIIRHTPFTIGRSGQDMTIPLEMVSGHHATITFANKRYYITDNNSRNGTAVNQQRISGQQPLESGATIQLGSSVTLEFTILSGE